MRTKLLFISCGIVFLGIAAAPLCADELELQNGDRYFGKVLSVSADTVVLQSDTLGKITLPRKKVASLAFGTNVLTPKDATNVAQVSMPTKVPTAASPGAVANTNADLSVALRNLGANTNFVRQIREQMLSGSPEAASKYDAMVSGLMSGKLNLEDLRREAKSSAEKLRALKRELGPEAGDSLDVYLEVLDAFLKEPAIPTPAPQPKTPVP